MMEQITLAQYKGYVGSVQHSKEDGIFYGEALFISDLISYESETLDGLQKSFEEAVDSYLNLCESRNEAPNTTCKGSFNVRMKPGLHFDLVRYGLENDMSLNKVITIAAERFINEQKRVSTVEFEKSSCFGLGDFFKNKFGVYNF